MMPVSFTKSVMTKVESRNRVRNTYGIRTNLSILNPVIHNPVLAPGGINAAVYDREGDVHSLWAELAGERLGEGALGELAGGKGAEEGGAADGGCCAGDEEGWWVGGGGDGGEEEGEGFLGEDEEAVSVSTLISVLLHRVVMYVLRVCEGVMI
jgi:hypothetical protein